jgi:molybdopterin adenylyltransferase
VSEHAPARTVAFALLTVSDTRTPENDVSGRTMRELVLASGHRVSLTAIVRDDPDAVRDQVLAFAIDETCEAIVSSGGTGLSARDHTVEAVSGLFDVRIDGFGELFRQLSYGQIGSAAMLSRASAGVVRGTPVFLLPGSPKAVSLALTELVLPQIAHIIGELRRQF